MYHIRLTPQAMRDMDDVPPEFQPAMAVHINDLAHNPRPAGSAAIRGRSGGSYRLRVGNYRVAYDVDNQARSVTVWAVGHRKRFYDHAQRRRPA